MFPVMFYIGLPDYEVSSVNSKRSRTLIKVATKLAPECPCCGGTRLRSRGRSDRIVRHLNCFKDEVELDVVRRRYRCQDCLRTFNQALPGIGKGRRFTEPYLEKLYQDHEDGISAKRLAEREGIGAATVARNYNRFTQLKARERSRLECPAVLGIDEHTLHRNGKYVTTFCDLRRHKVFDVAEGRSASELKAYLEGLKGRHKVSVICIDMSNPYRALIRRYFRNAIIVSDRFHVVRLVMHHFTEQAKILHEEIKHKRGLMRALRKRPEKLTERQKEMLQDLFERIPVIKILYDKMRQICDLMNLKGQARSSCKQHIQTFYKHIHDLNDTPFEHLHKLAKSLASWEQPIGAMWRFRKNNSITEGFHRKMKLIQRRAYGFRNFNNYRLRVIAQCG
jgi:transposase